MPNNFLRSFKPKQEDLIRALFWLFLLLGAAARLWKLGSVPGGLNQDEAFAAYEAYSLLHTGLDTSGHPFPVYLTAWGSGMNALESYLMMPFVAVFGLKVWAIRLPQAIVAVLSLPAAYDILKRLAGEWAGLCGMLLMATAPWHILLSRWALESNLAPGFLLFGLCFFLRGLEDHRFFLLSALMYGLSLYCYATIWPLVPPLLLVQAGYALRCGQLRLDLKNAGWILLSALLLFLLALPLILFVLVNLRYIEEPQLPLISIPRMVAFRGGDFSLSEYREHAKTLLRLLYRQSDDAIGNTPELFGLFYPGTMLFAVVGACHCVLELARGLFTGRPHPRGMLIFPLAAALLQGLTIEVNVNRINALWSPILLLAAIGLWAVCCRLKLPARSLLVPMACCLVLFAWFECYYFTDYSETCYEYFAGGLEQAARTAARHDGTICASGNILYPRILFFCAQDPDEFRATVQYTNYPSRFLSPSSFGRVTFSFDPSNPDRSCVYLLDSSFDPTPLVEAGFTVEFSGYYFVAYYR